MTMFYKLIQFPMPGLWAFLGSYVCLLYQNFPTQPVRGGDVAMLAVPIAWLAILMIDSVIAAFAGIALMLVSALGKYLPPWLYSLIIIPLMAFGMVWPLIYKPVQ